MRRELHLPLSAGGEPLGVVSLGRLSGEELALDQIATVGQLADQAAVALANALAGDETRRLATITGAIVDGVTDAIVLTDPDGRVLMANAAARRLGGDRDEPGELPRLPADADQPASDEFALSSGREFQRVTAPVHLPTAGASAGSPSRATSPASAPRTA